MILSILLVSWFILFNQNIITKTSGYSVGYYGTVSIKEPSTTTENTNLNEYDDDTELIKEVSTTTENTDFNENDTDIIDEYVVNIVTDDEIPINTDDEKEMDKPGSSSDDIIELNVGGKKITTFRSTLTAVPKSKLALLFTKDNKNQPKQKKEYFFDYNPVQFEYLLDQLRTIKRTPEVPAHQLNIVAPSVDIRFNFSVMLSELGLNRDHFLSPFAGTHLNLKVDSLVGWKECYRGKYDTPFDFTVLTSICKGDQLLVACRSTNDKKTLVVAGVGERTEVFGTCPLNSYCTTNMKNGTGFYYVESHAWGFDGRPKDFVPNINLNSYSYVAHLNPCDSQDTYSEYRLCWSLRSSIGRGGGDRCGSSKNLHNTKGWERLIYQTS